MMGFSRAGLLSIVGCLSFWALVACSTLPGEGREQEATSRSGRSAEGPAGAECREWLHFRLLGLKDLYRADLCIGDAGAVTGSFYVFGEYAEHPTQTGTFAGSLEGTEITVQFASGRPPYPRAPEQAAAKRVRWHLDAEPAASRKLAFETYGRDYDRNVWRTYVAEMERARRVPGASLETITVDDLEAADAP